MRQTLLSHLQVEGFFKTLMWLWLPQPNDKLVQLRHSTTQNCNRNKDQSNVAKGRIALW